MITAFVAIEIHRERAHGFHARTHARTNAWTREAQQPPPEQPPIAELVQFYLDGLGNNADPSRSKLGGQCGMCTSV